MPTRKTIYWLLGAASLYLIALNVGSGWLYVLISAMAALPLASPLLSRLNGRRIQVSQRSPGPALQGDGINAPVSLKNFSRLPCFFLRLEATFGGSGTSLLVPFLRGGSQKEARLGFSNLARGVYTESEFSLLSSAPLGLAVKRRRLTSSCQLVVYPRTQQLQNDWDTGRQNAGYMVQSAIPARNISSDYLGVRDYRPEDSPRSIHWRTSARAGRLSVVEYAHQAAITPVVLVDTFAEANVGSGHVTSFEAAVSIAASLVQREASHNRRYGLGSSPAGAAATGLIQQDGPAMLWLAAVKADGAKPMELEAGALPWPNVTPVLILTSHPDYARSLKSGFFSAFPHSVVIMIDGRAFLPPDAKNGWPLMQDSDIESLGNSIEARGGRFLLIPSPEAAWQCLAKL